MGDLNGSMEEEWKEPPLRAPAPSFEDYKGLERHGVLEHMAPLGTFPGQKVKTRLKHHEPTRRIANLKNGEARSAREEVNTPEPAPPVGTRRSEPRRTEERIGKVSTSRETDHDTDYNPKGGAKVVATKAASTQPAPLGTPTIRNGVGQTRLQQIVESAIDRSRELGDPALGIALKQLYEESLRNSVVADLLEAVLSQKPTSQQTAEFQSYIKAARKHIRATDDLGKHLKHPASESISKSSTTKSARVGVTRHSGTQKDRTGAPGLNNHLPSSNNRSSKQRSANMELNGTPSKEERPSKRVKRSKSASSDSSLSSLDSAVEDFAPTLESSLPSEANLVTHQEPNQAKQKPALGPRLGSFSTRPIDPSVRKPISQASQLTPEELSSKRKEKLMQSYQDYVVGHSKLRADPIPIRQPNSTPPLAVLSVDEQQSRVRNGVSQRSRRDEPDYLDSPTSSAYGELLVPPPPGASRGATPNQLGRPLKAVKKAARVKMSPLKKRNAVTAGIGRAVEPENNGIAYNYYGRTDDREDKQNSDACTSCGGPGELVCCEGCWRAFHHSCWDPPHGKENLPEGDFYCYRCRDRRNLLSNPSPPGALGGLFVDLVKTNPIAFNLSHSVRDYFEGVKTGEEGEYEEATTIKANKARAGYEEVTNNFKLRDGKDNTVICFRCGKSALDHNEIVACDYCNLSWHLDCIDPPLAAPPVRRNNGRPRFTWMCPNHVENELSGLDPALVKGSTQLQPDSSRSYKIRRPKKVNVVTPAVRRGLKNSGLIEIELDVSDEETRIEKNEKGKVVYRYHETGIKLDFIHKAKLAREQAAQAKQVLAPVQSRPLQTTPAPTTIKVTKPQQASSFDKRPFSERKAALNLAQLAQSDATLNSDTVKNLIGTLIAEAPGEVETLYKTGHSAIAAPSEQEKKDLLALIDLARRRLDGNP